MAVTETKTDGAEPRVLPVVDMEIDRPLLKQCVHCGLCLDVCPTYRALGVEMDSPRGRIYQIKAVYEGKVRADDPRFRQHVYACLDCRACQTACPAGVQYGKLIEAARGVSEPNSAGERRIVGFLLRRVFTSQRALNALGYAMRGYQKSGLQRIVRASGLLKLLPRRLGAMESMMPTAQGGIARQDVPALTPAIGERKYRVGFIAGCVMSQLQGETNQATARVLARNGCEVVSPEQQGCCGALHVHSGDRDTARTLARRNIEAYEALDLDAIIINAAGCGSTLKEYGDLLERDPAWRERAKQFAAKVKDISEFLASIELNRDMGEVRKTVTYQDACHLVHGQGVRQQPRELLRAIPGLTLVEMTDSDTCCGSAGIYNLTHPDLSQQILTPKMENIKATRAETLVVPNPGCAMQISYGARQRAMDLEVMHVVDLLDQAYRAADAARYAARARGDVTGAGQAE
ncbi:MAG: 4Fe-4S dicluster domain-containing protein [Chloroflexi bacterium]|nr:4Fe-4S dicluster domain-containing protein [Chloroflexota bacterium]